MKLHLNTLSLSIAAALAISAAGCSSPAPTVDTDTPPTNTSFSIEANQSTVPDEGGTLFFATTEPPPSGAQKPAVRTDAVEETSGDLILRLLSYVRVADPVELGYSRDLFRHWIDADRNGCDTRKEVLLEEAIDTPLVLGNCKLDAGSWYSEYDGLVFEDSSKLDIDHFIPLKEAWESGADRWSSQRREEFANDLGFPGSLIAVSATTNRSKSDRDPAQWLPTNEAYRCTYLITWLEVKIRWNLAVDQLEASSIIREAKDCG